MSHNTTGSSPVMSVRIPREMRDRLDEIAKSRRCNRQDLVLDSIDLWLRSHHPRVVNVKVEKVKVSGTIADKRRWWHRTKSVVSQPTPNITIVKPGVDS